MTVTDIGLAIDKMTPNSTEMTNMICLLNILVKAETLPKTTHSEQYLMVMKHYQAI